MSIRARIEKEKNKLRQKIIKATLELLNQKGYKELSIRKVAARIKYSPTTIYLYFKNKDELIENVIDDGFFRFQKELSLISFESTSPLQKLIKGFRTYINFALKNPHWYQATFTLPLGLANYNASFFNEKAINEKGFAILAESLQQCMDSGEITQRPIYPVLLSIWAALHGVAMLLLSNPLASSTAQEKIIETFLEIIVSGLKKNDQSSTPTYENK